MIRDVTSGDAQAIAAIYNDYILNGVETFETEPLDVEQMLARIETISAEFPYFVFETDGGEAVAYAYAHKWKERDAYAKTLETSVYVAREFCGSGIGRKLAEQLVGGTDSLHNGRQSSQHKTARKARLQKGLALRKSWNKIRKGTRRNRPRTAPVKKDGKTQRQFSEAVCRLSFFIPAKRTMSITDVTKCSGVSRSDSNISAASAGLSLEFISAFKSPSETSFALK